MGAATSSERAIRGSVRVLAHPPERGRRSVVLASGGCSSSCCCCCLFVPGAFVGAIAGGTAAVAGPAASDPGAVEVRGRAVALYWVCALLTALAAGLVALVLAGGGDPTGGVGLALVLVLVGSPAVLLVACVPAALHVRSTWSDREGRREGLATIGRIGLWTFLGTAAGAGATYVFLAS